jgi:predicted nucleotidyltransferase
LDTLIYAWQQGNSAEEILDQYPALNLADIHAVLAWALRNPQAIKDYMQNCAEQEKRTIQELEADPKIQAFKGLLRERMKTKGLG